MIRIELDKSLVAEVDAIAGVTGRSAFVREAVEVAVQQARRWASLDAAAGTMAPFGHAWDDEPAAWVRTQRRSDPDRAG